MQKLQSSMQNFKLQMKSITQQEIFYQFLLTPDFRVLSLIGRYNDNHLAASQLTCFSYISIQLPNLKNNI